jgi:hypothetical protein
MMMKELEESNWFKMVEERKTQGLVSVGREGMIFGDERCLDVHPDVIHMIYQMFQPLVY